MKLGGRNLFYSMTLAGFMMVFLVGYFVYMLPSLYVDYTMEQNLRAVKEQHRAFVKNGNYDNVQLKNPTACFSLKIPDEGESIGITTKMFSATITIKDQRIQEIFHQLRDVAKSYGQGEEEVDRESIGSLFEDKNQEWKESFGEVFNEENSMPFELEILARKNMENEYRGEYEKIHMVTDDFVVFEMGVRDNSNQYVNYIGVERGEDCLFLTFLPAITPDMNEIRPIVFQSLPMLGAVICLLVLLFSQVYSRGIVTPVVQLVEHTEQMKNTNGFQVAPMEKKQGKREDEIGVLAETIDDLYRKVRESYISLEEKNQALLEENKRQEVLLRASSHQLKTPISAALLLVEGMMNKVGKYQDREAYLPQVKRQLLSMKKMVEDILYLNHCGENLDFQWVDFKGVLENQLQVFRIPIKEKKLQISREGEETLTLFTDEIIVSHIIGNLLSNAVNYTPEGGEIRIYLEKEKLTIQNFGVCIPEELLPHIFEPFVSGNHEKSQGTADSHGLGLYIGAYYAKQIGMEIHIENGEKSVVTVLIFENEKRKNGGIWDIWDI
ncbi:MAG: HAMP domain-containing histidine kinase [Roseburia sp.]|nr:HAMP domain-containing histidine kinase [Roseburia sp.]